MSVALSRDEADVHASHSLLCRDRGRWKKQVASGRIQVHSNACTFDITPPKNLEEVLTFSEKGHKEAEMPSLLGEEEKVYAWRDCWP